MFCFCCVCFVLFEFFDSIKESDKPYTNYNGIFENFEYFVHFVSFDSFEYFENINPYTKPITSTHFINYFLLKHPYKLLNKIIFFESFDSIILSKFIL